MKEEQIIVDVICGCCGKTLKSGTLLCRMEIGRVTEAFKMERRTKEFFYCTQCSEKLSRQ